MNIIFIHGTRTDSSIWEDQMQAAQDAGHQSISIDLPGHGSRQEEDFTLERSHEVILSTMDQHGWEQVTLVGLSLGGYVALDFAAKYPSRTNGVMAAACATETQRKVTSNYRKLAKKIDSWHSKFRAVFEPTFTSQWKVVDQMLTAMSATSSIHNLSSLFQNRVPLLMISGSRCPLRFGEGATKKALGSNPYIIIPRSGHDVNRFSPVEFNRHMLNFISSAVNKALAPVPAI